MAKIKSNNIEAEQVINKYEDALTPQADSLSKISVAIEVMLYSPINEKDLASGFSMDKRQAKYYSDAMKFLGVISTSQYNGSTIIFLSKEALKHFAKTKGLGTEKKLAEWIVKNELIKQFEQSLDARVKNSTYDRRLQTLKAWKKFIAERGK